MLLKGTQYAVVGVGDNDVTAKARSFNDVFHSLDF
jgi:hypothetical protein